MNSKKLKAVALRKLTVAQRVFLWTPLVAYAVYVGWNSYISKYGVDDFSFYDHRGMVSCVLSGGGEPSWTCKNSSGLNMADEMPVDKKVWSYDDGAITVTRTVSMDGARYTVSSYQLSAPLSYVVK